MESRDVILGHVLVERGWLGPEELEDCLRECAARSLSSVVVDRRAIPKEELEALWSDISKVLARGADEALDHHEDLMLGQYLRSTGQVSAEHLQEAEASRRSLGKAEIVPRLSERLLERGLITLAALDEALHARKALSTPVTCRSCGAGFVIIRYDAGRVYLCRTCTGELRPSAETRERPPALEAGPRGEFGKYGQAAEIGRGGMGVVYKAWDEAHKRWVALKVVHDSGSLEELGRFRREVEIARSLHHPNIVKLYEVTQVDSRHLIAMEYVDGKTLGAERLAPKRAAELVSAVARAVQYAHSRGIIHRDIKPQNIMVDRAGKPYLMDFGLAKSVGTPSSITSVGTVMGTPGFMAPEQAIGRSSRIDRRTDVYSLGAVLYYLVTGRPPFRGATPMDTIRKVVDEALTPPSAIVPDLPPRLEPILLKCLDKDKNRRYQTARHLADELDRSA